MSNQNQNLDTCGCCEGIKPLTPARVHNLPGLSALAYRVGTHASFKMTMQSALSRQPRLRALTTRDEDDPAVALCDAWATVLDVLSFYQERIANEGYLQTAIERRSILEMARSIGYELRPGVAASTFLAFTLEDAPGSPRQTTIDIGTKVQSIPGPNENPQTFETIEKIEARAEWNAIKPRLTKRQQLSTDMERVIIQGTATDLKPGNSLLIVAGTEEDNRRVRRVKSGVPDAKTQTTCIELETASGGMSPSDPPIPLQENVFIEPVNLTGTFIETEILGKIWKSADLLALAIIQRWSMNDLRSGIAHLRAPVAAPAETVETGVFAFRKRAALFGYNAPKQVTYNKTPPRYTPDPPAQWDEWTPANDEAQNRLFLDNAYDEVVPGSYIAIHKPNSSTQIFTIDDVKTHPRTEYGMSGKTSEITLPSNWWTPTPDKVAFKAIRETVVDVQSEQLELAQVPIPDLMEDNNVLLDSYYPYLKAGQRIILSGELIDQPGVIKSEPVMVDEVTVEDGFTRLTFTKSLTHHYVRSSVTINANVARATHGETKTEVLGSGDGSEGMQKFILKQTPLTYVSASTPSGTKSTMEIRVNDVLWEEVSTLYQLPPEKRAYIARLADDGKVTVQFGDSMNGARLPTGVENVRATYRVGTGFNGMVNAEQISLLMTRPLGVKGVINPLAPTGGADPEQRDQARQNAPLTVLTLDRIVSLQDFEDFTRAFAGIGKAQATVLWNGEQRMVHLTIGAADGGSVDETSDLFENLIAGIDAARHPDQQVWVDSYQLRMFDVVAKVGVDSHFIAENVREAAFKALHEAFAFDTRDFGQAVTASEVLAVMQKVEGVIAVDLDQLYFTSESATLNLRLPAHIAHRDQNNISVKPAELLIVNPDGINLMEMTA